jgi:hypothetical protein
MSISANLIVLLVYAAAPDGGERPELMGEVVQENKTVHDLLNCVRQMRAAQVKVRDATVLLDKQIQANKGHATRDDNLTSLKLRDQQQEICQSVEKLIARLEQENAAVAFVEVLRQLQLNMQVAVKRLGRTDPGAVTVTIMTDTIETFDEMIDALTKTR